MQFTRLSASVAALWVLGGCLWGSRPAASEIGQKPRNVSDLEEREVYYSQQAEARLSRWKPGTRDADLPAAAIRHPNMNIAGEWILGHSNPGSTLTIRPTAAGRYDVEFYTAGCLEQLRLKRTGRYRGGTLELDRPVEEYAGATYAKLHAVRVQGIDYLVPAPHVRDFQKQLTKDKRRIINRDDNRYMVVYTSFRRNVRR
jgi:hypothetical protein